MADPRLAPTSSSASPDERARLTPQWGLGDAAVGWLLGFLGSVITGGVALQVTGAADGDELSLGWLAFAMSGMWLGLVAVPLVAPRLKGNGVVRDLGLVFRLRDLPIGGVCGVAAQFLVGIVYRPLLWLLDIDADEVGAPAREMTDRAADTFGIVMLVLIVGLAAPVVEEIFYRGLLQRSMQRRFGVWPGLLLASLVFGVAHLQPLQLPALALAGLVFGLLAQRSGRLGPAITAHVAFNMVTVVTLVWL